ncbi:MAG: ribbon-helix-helix protein, CopG family [Thalassospira sp.]|nr:ribbon-helix-helix protein, CopG family [Thalassospira sp.]
MTTTQGIKIDSATRQRLSALAANKGRTPHWIMRTAIEQYVEREERFEREKEEDAARWAEYLLTGEAIPHAEAAATLQKLTL